ncbi:DUF3014 domain-containing protein [Variovorax sp. J22R133]|uniref:DUF3014 domain-containing protein n=1 Tax=Variovorax brevis TaxID=3053503 RepID=UPI002577CBE3|nr:DUF3014 domain-containing protein [Variovorax sp. J22R133]MDM0112815.1 DUF3014 domain-containing protein [Variovorax sp. J22R133]
MPDRDRAEFRPVRESSVWTAVVVVVLLLGAGALWWRWSQEQAPLQAPPAASTAEQTPTPSDMAPPPVADASPQNPIDTPQGPLPPLGSSDSQVTASLNELFGKKNVISMLQVDGFVRRFVATVDNLPREHAAPRMWPVHPMGKRFSVSGSGEAQAIALDNGSRYTPLILMAETVDPARAAKVYTGLYPLFQQAYEELGYPGKYFNDRLVAVIDHLLRAPEPQGPLRVKLTEVKGDSPLEQPWVHYEFADPQLESLSAGQKMMVRVGLVNERRIKARLKAFRDQVATGEFVKK